VELSARSSCDPFHLLLLFISAVAVITKRCLRGFLIAPVLSQVWKRAADAKVTVKESNLNGDGLTMGGLLVMRRGDLGAEFAFAEHNFGDHAEAADILDACSRAAKA
jgi:hypothetical protein